MSTEENKAVVRRLHEITNQGNLALMDDLVAPTFVLHDPNNPTAHTGDEYKQASAQVRNAFPDLRWDQEDVIAVGDKVVERWTFHGMSQGAPVSGIASAPPAGKQVAVSGITIYRLADGKIVEEWAEYDQLGMQQQLGLIPAPEQAHQVGT